jgi:hypothetical protein
VAAKSALIGPPSEIPKITAVLLPGASITARTSSIGSSSVGNFETLSDKPVPRLSKIMSLKKNNES